MAWVVGSVPGKAGTPTLRDNEVRLRLRRQGRALATPSDAALISCLKITLLAVRFQTSYRNIDCELKSQHEHLPPSQHPAYF